jgi:hypothetical protein
MIPFPLGLAFVAAACRRAGHETVLLDLMSEPDATAALQKRIEEFRPGAIGISVRNIDDQNRASPKFLLPAVRGRHGATTRALPSWRANWRHSDMPCRRWKCEAVCIPASFPETARTLDRAGWHVLAIDVSELQKAEAGVTCMSLIFNPQ